MAIARGDRHHRVTARAEALEPARERQRAGLRRLRTRPRTAGAGHTSGPRGSSRDELERAIELDKFYAPRSRRARPRAARSGRERTALGMGARGRVGQDRRTEGVGAGAAARRRPCRDGTSGVPARLGLQWAENAFREAMALRPGYDYARQRNARLLARAWGHVADALRELETSQQLDPLSDSIDSMVIPILQYAGRFDEAETLLMAVRNRLTNPLMVHNQLGRIYAATGQLDRAIEEFSSSGTHRPGPRKSSAEIAAAMAGAGRLAKAQAILIACASACRTEEIPPRSVFVGLCAPRPCR